MDVRGKVNRPPPDAAYGPSWIISSRRRGKQIDLWTALTGEINMRAQPLGITGRDKGGSTAL
jgi:hypothetical protein